MYRIAQTVSVRNGKFTRELIRRRPAHATHDDPPLIVSFERGRIPYDESIATFRDVRHGQQHIASRARTIRRKSTAASPTAPAVCVRSRPCLRGGLDEGESRCARRAQVLAICVAGVSHGACMMRGVVVLRSCSSDIIVFAQRVGRASVPRIGRDCHFLSNIRRRASRGLPNVPIITHALAIVLTRTVDARIACQVTIASATHRIRRDSIQGG